MNMWRFFIALLLLCAPAQAQDYPIIGGGVLAPAATYSGPCNIVSGATAWYGLRACSAAYAAAGSNAINVRRASDNTTENIAVLSTGALNISAANTFAGTDATASCTFATTTATCTGASSTPHVGSTITGSGITQPCVVTAVGTFTGGSGTLTVSGNTTLSAPCGTIAVAVSITLQYGLYVTEAYDQSGNANHVTQSTASDQPQLFPNCGNNLPCMASLTGGLTLASTTTVSDAQPWTIIGVSLRLSSSGSSGWILGRNAQAVGGFTGGTANQAAMYAGTNLTATANDNVLHALAYIGDGSSSAVVVDDTATSGSSGTNSLTNPYNVMSAGGSNELRGYVMETGFWGVAFSSTQYGNMCHNQYAYWATGVSC